MKNALALLTSISALLLATGCASKASMDARYDASLQRWQGATRAQLEATWGRPTFVQSGADGGVLTWVVRNDSLDDRPGATGTPSVVVSRVGNAPGSASVTTVMPGAPVAAVVPITCTTHFTLKDGRVASWRFEGLGCGAPF